MAEKTKRPNVLRKYEDLLSGMDPLRPMGRVVQITGMSIISEGPPEVSVGDLCRVKLGKSGDYLNCEAIGFQNNHLVLTPLGPTAGVYPDAQVLGTGRQLSMPVSDELLGRVSDGLGRPLDNRPPEISRDHR